MIQMSVTGVGFEENTGQPIVLLNDQARKHALPILIGIPEAGAISRALQQLPLRHRSTHRLVFDLISSFGYKIDRAVIDTANDGAFLGVLSLAPHQSNGNQPKMDFGARPSDAIVLSLMHEAPLFVSEEILVKRGIELKAPDDTNESEQFSEQFKEFVESVKASDFNKYGPGPAQLPE